MKEINFDFTIASDDEFEDLIADIGFENNSPFTRNFTMFI